MIINLSSDEVAAMRRLLSALTAGDAEAASGETEATSRVGSFSRAELREKAREVYLDRRARNRIFGDEMFGEPGWDMLLALYMNESVIRLKVSRLCEMAGAPPTTAIRWLETLESQGMMERSPHPTDRRSFFVGLTDPARAKLDAYFSEILSQRRQE